MVFNDGGILKAYAWNDHAPVEVNLFDGAYSLRGVHSLECIDSSNAKLRGSSADDAITGGSGNDVLWGAAGADALTGGAGVDVFYWGRGDGDDFIADGEAGETLMLYTPGLATSDVSVAVSGTTLVLTCSGSTLRINNWSEAGMNSFVFGAHASASNTYRLAATSNGYGWLQT